MKRRYCSPNISETISSRGLQELPFSALHDSEYLISGHSKALSANSVKGKLDMPFKGQSKSLKQPDIRIERLVVAIMNSKDLQNYFFDSPEMNLSCRYIGISTPYFGNANHVAEFLESLYMTDPERFRQFFQYVLNEIVEKKKPLVITSTKPLRLVDGLEVFDGFDRFLRELNVLGFDYDVDKWEVIPTIGHTKEDIKIETELEEMLDGYDPKYREMLRGAWESFLSYNPDRYRHTVVSLRELTRMIIQQLAPEEKTRKDRIRRIIASKKEGELVESLAETVVKLQDMHSNKVHDESDYESTLFALKATEYLLFFLLKKARRTK